MLVQINLPPSAISRWIVPSSSVKRIFDVNTMESAKGKSSMDFQDSRWID